MISLKRLLFTATFLMITFVAKQALAGIPNVQAVSLLMTLFFLNSSWKESVLFLFGYVILDFLVWGYPTLMLPSFAAWIILAFFVKLIRSNEYKIAFFMIPFTLIHMITYMVHDWFFFGLPFNQSIVYLIAGIPFAIPMLLSSFVSILLLLKPINKILTQIPSDYVKLNKRI